MDLNIILWIGGMLFSLGIFAIKVGFGLGFSGMKWKGVLITLFMYLMLFVAIAVLSGELIKLLEPVLKKGPYLHALMAAGMIVWGIYLLRSETDSRFKIQDLKFKIQNSKTNNSELSTLNSLLLLIPCPVCLSAMTFSTWAALSVIKLPAYIVGAGLGAVFVILSVVIYFFLKLITHSSSLITQRMNLGLSMIAIGFYFIASIFIPAKIEEAKGVYGSFVSEGSSPVTHDLLGVFAILSVAFLVGFVLKMSFSGLTRESRRRPRESGELYKKLVSRFHGKPWIPRSSQGMTETKKKTIGGSR